MARKKKKAPEGAPAWVVSYGDMMSLLLTFFILLASIASYEDVHERFMTAIESIREALGMKGQVGRYVDASVDYASLIQKLESLIKPDLPKDRGDSDEEGIYGRNCRLRRIREGTEITMGGPIMFEPFSSELTEEGQELLAQVGNMLRGHRNKIQIRGHAAEEPRPEDWTYEDAMLLSYQRAKTVADRLILRGVDPRTITLAAVGSNEPLARGVYDMSRRGQARRVEIIVRETLIDDYLGQSPLAGETDSPSLAGDSTDAVTPVTDSSTTRPAPAG